MAYQFHEFPHTHNYDDDLREVLALMESLNHDYAELVDGFNKLQSNFDILESDFVKLKNDFNEVLIEFSKFEDQIASVIVSLDDKQRQINELKAMYAELYNMYDSFLTAVNTIVDAKINLYDIENKKYIGSIVKPIYAQLKDIWKRLEETEAWTMYSRLAGKRMKTVDVINDYYEGLRVHCITVSEYGEMQLSVNDYLKFKLSTRNYATMSRDILKRWFKFAYVNPFTGLKNSIDNIHSWIVTNMLNATTINNYDAEEVSVEEYDAMNLTVIDYYRLYPNLFGYIGINGNGLTAEEYSQLRII